MGQLTNQFVSQSYQGLLNLANANTGFTANLQTITDGLGGSSPLQMSQTQVNISGTFTVNGAPVSVDTGSLVTTSSFNAYTSSVDLRFDGIELETGSLQNQINGLATTSSLTSLSSSIAVTDLNQNNVIAGLASTGSLSGYTTLTTFNNYTSSNDSKVNSLIAGTGSYATTSSLTALSQSIATTDLNQDNRLTALENATGSINRNGLITTGSLGGSQSITGSLNVEGTITATSASFTYVTTTFETASVIYSSGSNQFGDASNDTQTLFGTVRLPNGPLSITGSAQASSTITSGDGFVGGYITSNINLSASGDQIVDIKTNTTNNFGKVRLYSTNNYPFRVEVSGSLNASGSQHTIVGNTDISGTLRVTDGITGSLEGTASYANNANSASFAPTIIPDWVATTGSNVFKGFQQILNDVEINSSNPVGTFVSMISTGTTSFLMDSPLTQFQSNGEMLFQNTISSTGSSDINFRTQNGGDIRFNTNNSGSVAITGSVILSGSAGPELDVKGDVLITGSVILSGSAGIELDVKGDQTNTGSLTVRSGTLEVISNNTTINNDLYLTSSVPGQSNIILGWGENPTAAGAAANQANYTGSFIITGSNNIVTLPILRPTFVGFNTTATGYISGSNNILNGNNSSIYLNGGSQLFPKTQGNYLSFNSNIYLNFTTSSIAGGHPLVTNNLIFAGQLDLNHPSGTINAVSNILAGGGITSTQNFVTNQRAFISNNNVIGGITLNHISSSISYANNYNNSPININNHLSSSITANALTFGNNAVFGGSGNTALGVWVSGSQSSNATRLISDNIIGGRGIIVSSSFVSSSNSNLLSSLIYGQNLIVSGSHGNTGGSAFLGRFNDATSLHLAQDIVFAVGTGISAANRRTGLYVTSGSLVGVSGSLDVKGNSIVTGSVTATDGFSGSLQGTASFATNALSASFAPSNRNGLITTGSLVDTQTILGTLRISGSSPLQVGTENNVGKINTYGGSNWLYRNSSNYNTVIGNVAGLDNGFFGSSEKNMVLNGFFSPFATGSNNVIIQGGGDDFISGSNNIFIGNHNGHAGGNNSILIGATSYSSGSILNDKFELGTISTARIFHKQGADALQIGDDTQVTGSLQVSNLATSTGSFVVTTDNNGTLTKAPYSGITSNLFNAAQYSTLQTLSGSANVSQSVYFDTTGPQFGVSLVDNTKLTVANPGTYNIQFSAQLEADGGADNVFMWFKKNGTNIDGSASEVELDNNKENIMTVNILDTAVANDYYEIAWQNANNNGRLLYQAASGNVPSTPSVIATITQVR
jgi:hypothetical protein